MTESSKNLHNILLSICFSVILWIIIDNYLISIKFWQFILIEIAIAIMEIISKFVKEKSGIQSEKFSNTSQEKINGS